LIDLHCHILPDVDDGPPTVDDAIALARGAQVDGITTIVATPHVDWAHAELGAARIGSAVQVLQAQLHAAAVNVTLASGAEVGCTWAWERDDAELRALTLGGHGWLLLECPHSTTITPGFVRLTSSLARRGHRLLLAHPERCPIFQREPELLDDLVCDGMLVQVTAGSLSGRFGRRVREFALALVNRGTAHVVASDGHGVRRPAKIASELRAAGVERELATWLARDMPAAVLAGDPLPARPVKEAARSRRRFLRLVGRDRGRPFTGKSPVSHH
jgi:protein-tyrosine phosphatase